MIDCSVSQSLVDSTESQSPQELLPSHFDYNRCSLYTGPHACRPSSLDGCNQIPTQYIILFSQCHIPIHITICHGEINRKPHSDPIKISKKTPVVLHHRKNPIKSA